MLEKREYTLPSEKGEKGASFYWEPGVPLRAVALYLHGGAMLYGSREDLPSYHLERLCGAGCGVLALDYPLAPGVDAEDILADVRESVNWYLENRDTLFSGPLPYFLWGRSAGAYLCLLTAERGLPQSPAGVLSYYGYGLLEAGWYESPSPFYLRYPRVPASCLATLSGEAQFQRTMERGYLVYVHLRQTGKWEEYMLRQKGRRNPKLVGETPPAGMCPVLLAHSREDPDVSFREFEALSQRYPDSCRLEVPLAVHDFDRDVGNVYTEKLLQMSVDFILAHS